MEVTYMKPTIAVIFMRENMYSASPYVLTPNKLMMTIARRKMATNIDLLRSSFQYPIVKAPAIIEMGRINSHCRQ